MADRLIDPPQQPLARVQQLFRAGRAAEAERLAREVVAANPSSPAALNVLALVLKGRGALEEAEKTMRLAIAGAPQDAALQNNLGNILRMRSDPAGAEQCYRRAVALARDYAEAFCNLGIVLAERGRKEEALAAYRRAVAVRPGYAEAFILIGVLLAEKGQNADALAAYERAATLDPRLLPAHRAFSMLAGQMGERARAADTYVRARARLGDDPDLLLAEAALRLQLEEPAVAEDLARRAGAQRDARILLAQALIAQMRFDESIPLLEQCLPADTGEPVAHRELGIALLSSGQCDRAVSVLEEAHRLAPADQLILAYLTLAWREAGQGRYADLVDFDKYVRSYELPVDGLAPMLAAMLESLHTRREAPLNQTLRGGTQTSGNLFANEAPEIAALRDAVRAAVADYIAALPDDPAHPFLRRKTGDFVFAGSWSCRLRSSGYHTNHVHQQGWISSACYIALPEAVTHGEQGWLKFGESNLALGARDVPERMVQPAVGKLVLFPSYYWHGTVPFTDAAPRLTVAFDVVPR